MYQREVQCIRNAFLVITDTDCWAQNGSAQCRIFETSIVNRTRITGGKTITTTKNNNFALPIFRYLRLFLFSIHKVCGALSRPFVFNSEEFLFFLFFYYDLFNLVFSLVNSHLLYPLLPPPPSFTHPPPSTLCRSALTSPPSFLSPPSPLPTFRSTSIPPFSPPFFLPPSSSPLP